MAEAPQPPKAWYVAMAVALVALVHLGLMILYLIFTGVGVWDENRPGGWAFDITNFVFWVGIGHAGTLISAILFLFRQKWRTGINRFAEAMTIFAVVCAGIFPPCISAASGSPTGCSPIQTRWGCGPIS